MVNGFNHKIYNNLIQIFINEENIFKISSNTYLFKEYLKDHNFILDKVILNQLVDENLKLKSKEIYSQIKKLNLNLTNLNSNKYPNNFLNIITYGNNEILKSNNKIIYVYYNKSFSSNGKNVYNVFMQFLLKEEVTNLFYINNIEELSKINSYESNNIYLVNCYDKGNSIENKFKKIKEILLNTNNLIIFNNIIGNNNNIIELLTVLADYIIIPEAALQKEIIEISDIFCELGKDILVAPSNIYQKTSYFSNYLIKQGCDIILSTKDIKFYIDKNKWNFSNWQKY